MHFTIITRCYEPDHLQQIKENVASIFNKQTEHNYKHLILADLTHGEVEQHFKDFADNNTQINFVHQKDKEDKHICQGVDRMLENYNQELSYVYMLDDDNLLRQNFLDVAKEFNPETDDVIIFKVQGHKNWAREDIITKRHSALGILDWSCILTRLDVMKDLKLYIPQSPRQADGRFINKVLKSNYHIKYLEQVFGIYNVLQPNKERFFIRSS